MQGYLTGVTEGTEVLLVLSVILFAGFIMTRLTNTLNLPKVSGYILAGILIGPCGLNMIPKELIGHMSFISDLALAFIAFGVGKFFKKEVIRKTGFRIIVITIFEALMAGFLVTVSAIVFFHLDLDFALILGAIATATAPASTMMTINQYKAKGEFVNVLLQIVALDDVVCLMAFSVVAAIAGRDVTQEFSMSEVMLPIVYNLLALGLGFFCGYFLSRLLIPARSRDNRLILAIAMLLGISGICAALDISPLLACMMFGAAYINLTRDKKLYRQINNFTPPVMSIFFIVSGMNLDLSALKTVGAIGVAYFVIRIIGKYLGTYVSCWLTGTSKAIRNYMGLALIPQAGVAIGLAFLGQRLLPGEKGNLLLTIILSSSVLYEMVGPVSAKAALFLSGCITTEKMKQVDTEIVMENQGLLQEHESEKEKASKTGETAPNRFCGKPFMESEEVLEKQSLVSAGDDSSASGKGGSAVCSEHAAVFADDDIHELEEDDIIDVESTPLEKGLDSAEDEAEEDESCEDPNADPDDDTGDDTDGEGDGENEAGSGSGNSARRRAVRKKGKGKKKAGKKR